MEDNKHLLIQEEARDRPEGGYDMENDYVAQTAACLILHTTFSLGWRIQQALFSSDQQ